MSDISATGHPAEPTLGLIINPVAGMGAASA